MKQVMAAEADLPEDSPNATRQSTLESSGNSPHAQSPLMIGGPVLQESRDRDELYLPSETSFEERQKVINSNGHFQGLTQFSEPSGMERSTEESAIRNFIRDTTPSRPPKEPETSRHVTTYATLPDTAQPRPAPKRKPVASASGSSATPAPDKPPAYSQEPSQLHEQSRAALSPVTDQTHPVLEKVGPLTQSLQSLHAGQYLRVELDQGPVQPYADNPPAYAVSLTSLPDALSLRRAETLGALTVDEPTIEIIRVVRENRIDDLRRLVKSGANVNEVDSSTGRTAIMEAARFRRWDICRLLTQSGSRVHLKDTDGNTALHLAAAEGDAEICQMLLLAGSHTEDFNGSSKYIRRKTLLPKWPVCAGQVS